MSEIKVNKISPATGTETTLGDSSDDFLLPSGAEIIAQSGSTITIAGGATLANAGTATGFGGGGKCLQVVQTPLTLSTSTTTNAWTDISGFTVTTGTLASTGSKCLVTVSVSHGKSLQDDWHFRLMRDSTPIQVGTEVGSNRLADTIGSRDFEHNYGISNFNFSYLDSPSTTSATTYKMQWRVGQGTHYINRDGTFSDTVYYPTVTSSIIVMEIGA